MARPADKAMGSGTAHAPARAAVRQWDAAGRKDATGPTHGDLDGRLSEPEFLTPSRRATDRCGKSHLRHVDGRDFGQRWPVTRLPWQ